MLDTAEVWLLVCRTFFLFCLQHFIRCLKEKAPYNASILTAITVRISFVCVVLILVITHINSDSNRYDGRGSLRPSYGKNSDASMLAHFNILFFCLSFVWIRMENLTGLLFCSIVHFIGVLIVFCSGEEGGARLLSFKQLIFFPSF